MKKVIIAKSEIITGAGMTLFMNWENLYKCNTGIKKIEHFDTDSIEFKYASVINLNRNNLIEELIKQALTNFDIPENTFIIWTGIKGNSEAIENKLAQPVLSSYYRNKICDFLDIKSNGIEINAACASGTAGLIYASQLISSGRETSILVCGADIVSRFTHMGFSSLRALSKEQAKPFDKDRDGLNLGDGAFAVLLTDEDTAIELGYTPDFILTGWGISNDANHITGPDRFASGLINAITKTLKRAGKNPDEIGAYCAHGTGTVYNDAMELTAVESIFSDRELPVFSIKGAIGHTLGAAGGIEAALCTLCLKEKEILPTAGLYNPEERAEGRVMSKPQYFKKRSILSTNSGFGGVNASVLIEWAEGI